MAGVRFVYWERRDNASSETSGIGQGENTPLPSSTLYMPFFSWNLFLTGSSTSESEPGRHTQTQTETERERERERDREGEGEHGGTQGKDQDRESLLETYFPEWGQRSAP